MGLPQIIFYLFCLFTFVGVQPAAEAAPPCRSAAIGKLLSFLNLDANGGRLQAWPGQQYVSDWHDEPGWDEITRIAGYDTGGCTCTAKLCEIEVRYAVLTSPQPDVFRYALRLSKQGWRITTELRQPHVYAHAVPVTPTP